jgi:hypothetical protein
MNCSVSSINQVDTVIFNDLNKVVTASGSGAFGVSGGGGKANGCPVKACVSSIIPDDGEPNVDGDGKKKKKGGCEKKQQEADAGEPNVDGDGKKKKQKADGKSDVGCGCGCGCGSVSGSERKEPKDAVDPVTDPVTPAADDGGKKKKEPKDAVDPVTDSVTPAADDGGKKKNDADPVTPTTDPVTPTTDPVTPTTDPVTTDPVTPKTTPVSPSFTLAKTKISIQQGTQEQIGKTRRLFTELYNGDKDFARVVNSKASTGYEILITDLIHPVSGEDNVLGRAVIGGYQMAIDNKHLDVSSDKRIQFTMAHEMAHSKGLRHADADFSFWEAALQDFS